MIVCRIADAVIIGIFSCVSCSPVIAQFVDVCPAVILVNIRTVAVKLVAFCNIVPIGKVIQVYLITIGIAVRLDPDAICIAMCVTVCDYVTRRIIHSYSICVAICFVVFYGVAEIVDEVYAFSSVVRRVTLQGDVVCGVRVSHHEDVIDAPAHDIILNDGVMSSEIDPDVSSRIFDYIIYHLDITGEIDFEAVVMGFDGISIDDHIITIPLSIAVYIGIAVVVIA